MILRRFETVDEAKRFIVDSQLIVMRNVTFSPLRQSLSLLTPEITSYVRRTDEASNSNLLLVFSAALRGIQNA